MNESERTSQMASRGETEHGLIAIWTIQLLADKVVATDRLGADYSVGTGLSADGLISHFWPKDKALWLTRTG